MLDLKADAPAIIIAVLTVRIDKDFWNLGLGCISNTGSK